MLEDYVVRVNLPINDTASTGDSDSFVLGSTYGYNPGEREEDPVWFWDGQDIWLPPSNSSVQAMFKGTIKFAPSGQDLGIGPETPLPGDESYPAIGDALVLQLWPQDFIKLKDLLPEGSPVPKHIVYQNIDRSTLVSRILALIVAHTEYREQYKSIFTTDTDSEEISDEEFRRRANTWVNNEWLNGRGIGVLVNPGDILGDAALVPSPPAGIDPEIRVSHLVPAVADDTTWRRLTLKVQTSEHVPFEFPFLIYNLNGVSSDQMSIQWDDSNLSNQSTSAIRDRFSFEAKILTQTDTDFASSPDADQPQALPDLVLQLVLSGYSRKVAVFFDSLDGDGSWRVQGAMPQGEFECSHLPHSLFGQTVSPATFTVWESGGSLTFLEPRDFYYQVRIPHWLDFEVPAGRRKRFVLGVNMETCRRVFYHDLSTNDITYRYDLNPATGQEEPVLSLTTAWMDDSTNRAELAKDLQNIKSLGASAVRVWVFEYFEGLRFEFTEPGSASAGTESALIEARKMADRGTHPQLKCRVFPSEHTELNQDPRHARRMETVHVCTGAEFSNLVTDWDGRGIRLRVSPPSNPVFAKLIRNARRLQSLAEAAGLRVLWTLWVHYGETKPSVNKRSLIYFGDDFNATQPTRNQAAGTINSGDWHTFYQSGRQPDPPTRPRAGRLPIEAWIYHALMRVTQFRQSYLENAVRPFVEAMERSGSNTLGYDLMNEPDVVWNGCNHSWTRNIGGDNIAWRFVMRTDGGFLVWDNQRPAQRIPGHYWDSYWDRLVNNADPTQLPTSWKLSEEWIRRFLQESRDTVHQAIMRVHRTRRDKVILCGVLGSVDDETENEMQLIMRDGHPSLSTAANAVRLDMSASAMTRYAHPPDWAQYDTRSRTGAWNVRLTSWLRTQNDVCLFLEAGDEPDDANLGHGALRIRQRDTVKEILEQSISLGYGGAFIWHYNNPARTRYGDLNALTEHSTSTEGTPFPRHSTIRYRIAAQELIDFHRRFRRIIL